MLPARLFATVAATAPTAHAASSASIVRNLSRCRARPCAGAAATTAGRAFATFAALGFVVFVVMATAGADLPVAFLFHRRAALVPFIQVRRIAQRQCRRVNPFQRLGERRRLLLRLFRRLVGLDQLRVLAALRFLRLAFRVPQDERRLLLVNGSGEGEETAQAPRVVVVVEDCVVLERHVDRRPQVLHDIHRAVIPGEAANQQYNLRERCAVHRIDGGPEHAGFT